MEEEVDAQKYSSKPNGMSRKTFRRIWWWVTYIILPLIYLVFTLISKISVLKD